MSDAEDAFWAVFLASGEAPGDAASRRFESFAIGSGPAADAGARLILSGRKTVTSARPGDFSGRPPRPGDFSILLDGAGTPVAIVETARVWPAPLAAADEALAEAYAEWPDLEAFRAGMLAHYRESDPAFDETTDLLFEDFRVAWRPNDLES
jgi:uncharacterized protein YhfF